MKPWNTWVAWLGCAGLSLALAGCGGSSVPDPESDANAAKGTLPSAGPAAPAVAESAPEPAPAPAPTPAPAPAVAEPPPAQPKPEEAAVSKPAEPAPSPSATPAAPGSPTPAPSASTDGKADQNNPFAVLSEAQSSPPATASPTPAAAAAPVAGAPAAAAPAAAAPPAEAVAAVPPQEVPPAEAAPAAEGNQDALGFLQAAAANRGVRKYFTNPMMAAMVFLAAIKEKDLNKVAQATALRAATESKNQKLFQLILSQELAQEDLDELSKKLSGYQVSGSNVPKSSGVVGITITKPEGTSIMRRNLTMRHEKAGWKVQDIGGEGELEKPIIMPRMGRGGMGGHRR